MSFRLRYLQHDLELSPGEFLIGRSVECQLSLDDPLVSRKHAVLIVTEASVVVRDLDSRNGVLVNGLRIQRDRALTDGDTLTIGGQELAVKRSREQIPESRSGERRAPTLTWMAGLTAVPEAPTNVAAPGEVSKRMDSLQLLGALADKALALGRVEEGERILSSALGDVLQAVQKQSTVSLATIELAGRHATKLAAATGKGSWVDYVIELYAAVSRPLPAAVIDELHGALRKVGPVDLPTLRAYVGRLRELAASLGPAERFLLQRIEGLERFASLR